MLGGNFWQKKPTLRMVDNQKPVAPNLDAFGKNGLQWGEQRNLDAHLLELWHFHGGEARIFQRSAHRASNDSLAQGFAGLGYPNTSLQAPSHMKGDENTARLGQNSLCGFGVRKLTVQDSFADGFAGQLEQGSLVGFREARHPAVFSASPSSAVYGVA